MGLFELAAMEAHNFYSDHRVIAGMTSDWYASINPDAMTALVEVNCENCPRERECLDNCNDAGCEGHYLEKVAIAYEVCPTCRGKGYHVDPNIDSCGISSDQFAEDPDFAEAYFSGAFDEPCRECRGERVMPVPDANDPETAKIINYIERARRAEADYVALCAAERRMGA